MSGAEALAIVGVVAAIVSAFHGGAELTDIIRERKEKRRKRKNDKESAKQIAQQEMLRESLVHGGQQVDATSYERRRHFGVAFERGDSIAEIELMRVVMNLQGEVIRALQMARDVENAVLNMTRLYEFSITNRQNAIRSMDELCQRLLQQAAVERGLASPTDDSVASISNTLQAFDLRRLERRNSDDSAESFRTASADLPASIIVTGPLSLGSTSSTNYGAPSRATSNASFVRSFAWMGRHLRASDADTVRTQRIVEESHAPNPARSNRYSSVPGASASYLLPVAPPQRSRASTNPQPVNPHHSIPNPQPISPLQSIPRVPVDNRTPSLSSSSSHNAGTISSAGMSVGSSEMAEPPIPVLSDPEHRASMAPEVVTPETSPRPRARSAFWDGTGDSAVLASSLKSYPQFLKTSISEPWAPLEIPSRSNSFHGYCEGAWKARREAKAGVGRVSKPYGMMSSVPYWQCKKCQFSARATSATSTEIPRNVHISFNGIRYRWLFLARSHLKSHDASGRWDAYTYGCIICTAAGDRETAGFGQVDLLMQHIMDCHAARELSPGIKERTRAITGRLAEEHEDWDINIPREPC